MKPPYICPVLHSELNLQVETIENNEIKRGFWINDQGHSYPIVNNVPNFIHPKILGELQQEQLDYYQTIAEDYDQVQHLTFDIQNENEAKVRASNISRLKLTPSSKILEVACGTGRDSAIIAKQLNESGALYLQDLSLAMLSQCQQRLKEVQVPVHYSLGNASYLAFPDNFFDAVYSFGGLNVFDDKKKSLKEMVRVTKLGGRIVVGDESMPPWLYETEFGQILLNNNKLFKISLPLEEMPVEARDVCVRWIIGGVYYLIDFTVGEGEPTANFDMEIPGVRGGTLNSRYFGQLEGVSNETKRLAIEAAKNKGQSLHQWLTDTVLKSASKDLDLNKK